MTNVFSKLAEEAKPEKTGGEAGFFLATVATADSDGITFIPDGQTAATQKRYKMIASGPMPVEGDRVVVMKHSGTCVVLGIIGMPDEPVTDEYVLKAGDTMTGTLVLSTSIDPVLTIKNPTYKVGDASLQANSASLIRFRDKEDTTFGIVRSFLMSNGSTRINMSAVRPVSDSTVQNGVSMSVSSTGARSVAVDDATAWRSALGLGTSGAFPLTIAQGGSGNTETYYTETVSNICTANSTEFSITSARYAQWGKIASIYVAGTGLKAHTNETVVMFTMASGKRPKIDSSARAWRNTSSLLHPDGTLDFNGTWAANNGFTFISTYLLA